MQNFISTDLVNFQFSNKTIYLLSSDRWGAMRISKHHYALELAERGNEVFFIEPPDLGNERIQVTPSGEHPSLYIVRYRPVYRGERYLPSFVFRLLLHRQVKILHKAIGRIPDVTWCFDPYRFLQLKWFKARINIFFAADLFYYDHLPEEARTADICLGVSDSIVESLKPANRPVYFINHGLNRYFAELGRNRLSMISAVPASKKITVGYVGYLLMEAPDRKIMRQIITDHKDIQFIFWGQYEKKGNFVALNDADIFDFVEFLKSQSHVVLRGPVPTNVLSEEMQQADMFWICWQTTTSKMWDGSNSHKILEYLSTGKPVVSHYMSTYRNCALIDMLHTRDNSGYGNLFSQVMERVKNEEPLELQQQRIQFAINNTYQAHISHIEELIQRHCS